MAPRIRNTVYCIYPHCFSGPQISQYRQRVKKERREWKILSEIKISLFLFDFLAAFSVLLRFSSSILASLIRSPSFEEE